jgi:photosystem II stability/assembly factor-like uncharacterized protein
MKAIGICKYVIFLLICVVPFQQNGQVVQINTGSNATLRDLSVYNNDVLINGYFGFLAKSTDGCASLIPLNIPGPIGHATRVQRLNPNTIFLLSYSPNDTYLFKSNDGGYNWAPRSVSTGASSHEFSFFDTLTGLMTDGPYLYKTINGGNTWTNVSCPFQIGTTAIKTFGDSIVCLGGIDVNGRGFMISRNRGSTWLPGWGTIGHGLEITDFFFLNKDTIFAVSKSTEVDYSTSASFYYSINGSNNWTDVELPLKDAYGIFFKSKKEGYVVGVDGQGFGTVIKTTDLGKTWLSFNTGYKNALINIAFINDSAALLSGTNGILLKWNYKSSVFTAVTAAARLEPSFSVFPNPVQNELTISFKDLSTDHISVELYNIHGNLIYKSDITGYTQKINISEFNSGMYLLKINFHGIQHVYKVIKE